MDGQVDVTFGGFKHQANAPTILKESVIDQPRIPSLFLIERVQLQRIWNISTTMQHTPDLNLAWALDVKNQIGKPPTSPDPESWQI